MYTEELSQLINKTNYSDLSEEVVPAAKFAILDFIGVAIAGSQNPSK